MIIQSSNTTLNSAQSYNVSSTRLQTMAPVQISAAANVSAQTSSGFGESLLDVVNRHQTTQNVKNATLQERLHALHEIRNQTFNYLLQTLFGRRNRTQTVNTVSESASGLTAGSSSGVNDSAQSSRFTSYFVYHEDETASFDAKGSVVTADGRTIDFNIGLTMSRSFTETVAEFIDLEQPVLCDPLVINLDTGIANVSDQKFLFDLDADGTEEEISYLGSGSGFLALDKNGDGVINDGSELFGTKSGNGFADLAKYDDDQNGWIDEADEIFSKLKVWIKDENGIDRLYSLKEAGIGALCLSGSATQFSLNDAANKTNAVIRQTGLFLYENGNAGTMQQLDLAT